METSALALSDVLQFRADCLEVNTRSVFDSEPKSDIPANRRSGDTESGSFNTTGEAQMKQSAG